jgi:hypothetical protein
MKVISLLFFLMFIALMASGVMAACVVPTENMTVTSTANNTLCGGGNYQFNITNGQNIIIINGNNFTFDCNGSSITGNLSSTSSGIYSVNKENITIKNCNISNFGTNINIQGATKQRLTLQNNILGGAVNYQIDFRGYNSTISNTTFLNTSATSGLILNGATNNINISNNRFYGNIGLSQAAITLYNLLLNGNSFDGLICGTTSVQSYYGFIFTQIENSTFRDNTYQCYQKSGILSTTGVKNILFNNDTFRNNDEGIYFNSINNVNITSSNFINNTFNQDAYALGIEINNSNNVSIINSVFSEIGTAGIYARKVNDFIVSGNSFSFADIASNSYYNWKDYNEPRFAIGIITEYKSYNTECPSDNNMNQACHSKYSSNLITVTANSFSSNTPVKLICQNCSGLTQDLSSYWYRKFNGLTSYSPYREYYVSDSYNLFSNINYSKVQSGVFCTGYSCITNPSMTWKLSSQYIIFININNTDYNSTFYNLSTFNTLINSSGVYQNQNATELNQTIQAGKCVALIYYGSASDPKITSMSDACNITEYSYVSGTSLTVTLSGTNELNLTQLTDLFGPDGYVSINGVHSDSENYSLTSPGTYVFIPDLFAPTSSGQCRSFLLSVLGGWNTLADMISLLIILLIVVVFFKARSGSLDMNAFSNLNSGVKIIGGVIITSVIVLFILVGLASVC